VPVSRPPIRNGAVLVRGNLIAAIGDADELADSLDAAGGAEQRHLEGCILAPGLVNAHTHLGLTAARGLLGPAPFTEWMPRLVAAMRAWEPADYAASALMGARECLEAGVTVVGDIVYDVSTIHSVAELGLGGTFFFEVLGVESFDLQRRLDEVGFSSAGPTEQPRLRLGISPHAVYSSNAALIAEAFAFARRQRVPFAMHLSESPAEIELVRAGTGPLRAVADRVAPGFEAHPGMSPVAYLDSLGVLPGITAIHLSQAVPSDITRLAATARGVVTCPRSNDWLATGSAPVAHMLEAGLPVGVGTDSLASNSDLDLMREIRTLQARMPQAPAHSFIAMATAHGALALGLETRFGVLEPGMQADVVAFRVEGMRDPEQALLHAAGAETVDAVMTAGEWRVENGRLLADTSAAEARLADAAARAREALSAS
jgi:cytosine/adenosine deaminase-related metal-dependent hydrolase